MNIALIVAAGRGTRLKSATAKQFLPLAGIPVLARTLLIFEHCPSVDSIFLVAATSEQQYCRRQIVEPLRMSTPCTLVAGGDSRQESVHNGLKAIGAGDHWVIIHDGVRPFVTDAQIRACLKSARVHGACTLALPAIDTLKDVDEKGMIKRTRPRRGIWLAQTPQVFRLSDIRKAHAEAERQGHLVTDDASLMELIGQPVAVEAGLRRNFKITTAEDLKLAEAIAAADLL